MTAVLVAENGAETELDQWSGIVDWEELTLDVTLWAGQSVSLRFEFDSDSSITGGGVWLDDVAVTADCATAAR